MKKTDPKVFLSTALTTEAISLAQYNEAVAALSEDPGLDVADFLRSRGFADDAAIGRIGDALKKSADSKPSEEKSFSENYKVERVLGQGGVGRVFLALEKNIGREVAIKELIGERAGAGSARAVARFVREAKISGQLEHPNIVPVYRLETRPDGSVYYVMRHVEGRTLLQAIREHDGKSPGRALAGRLSLLGDFIGVCEAIGYAHSKGIIHRDLKPSNVVLGEFGETIVLDWGLAKRLSDPETHDSATEHGAEVAEGISAGDDDGLKTIVGAKLGTPPYMSPEQIDRSLGPVDCRSDVYALGVMLYLMLTGEKPYSGNAREMMRKIVEPSPSPSPGSARFSVPPELAAICERAMSKKREERFANGAEMTAELKAYRDGKLVGSYAYTRPELFRRFIARHKAAVASVALVALSITGGLAFSTHYAIMADRARKQAEGALVEVTKISEEAVDLARVTVEHFEAFFKKLAGDIGAVAAEGLGENDARRLSALLGEHPEISALILTREGKAVAVPADAIGLYGLPPAEIDKVTIALGPGKFEATDAWKAADGRYAFAFVFPSGAGTDDKLVAVFTIDRIMPAAFAFDPKKHPYQIWCMDSDGTIIYDENPEEIGKNLFTDEIYANYPELKSLGEHMRKKPWGVGYYRFYAGRGRPVIYKIAAWEELSPAGGVNWKLVAAFPFESR